MPSLTILPDFTRLSINEKVKLSIYESIPSKDDESFSWLISDASIASFDGGDSSNLKFPEIMGNRIGTFTLSVIYFYTDSDGPHEVNFSKIIAVTWPGLTFGPLKASSVVPIPAPSLVQNPLNVEVANLRAGIAPCSHWQGPTRDYVVKSAPESGENVKDYPMELGYLVTSIDKYYDPSISDSWIGTVRKVKDLETRCALAAAAPWHSPDGNEFPPCNGAKPSKDNTILDPTVGRCPFYSSPKKFNHIFDDSIGFKKTGYVPKIAATHIQELRMMSDDWSQYANPKATFLSRFTIDPDIWAWVGYVKDNQGKDILSQIIVQKVSVNNSVTEIVIGPEQVIDFGTITQGGLPDYPTLIKDLFSASSMAIDFPKRPANDPFIVRNFTENQNKLEVYGHLPLGKATVYAVNTTYATARQYEMGIVPAKEDNIDNPNGGLPSSSYIQFLLDNVPDAVYTTTSANDGSFVFGMDYSTNELGDIDTSNRIKLLYSKADDSVVNEIRVYAPGISSGGMLHDTTYVKCRFLHGWVYQTSFSGNCDNTDSVFKGFESSVSVQLSTGFESIANVVIASPDLGSIYATWRRSIIEAPIPKMQSYYLFKQSRTVEVPPEDITVLHNNKEFIVRVDDTSASRLSYWNVTSASLNSSGSSLALDVVKHYDSSDYSKFELDGDNYKGVSYRDGCPIPANYLHLRIPAGSTQETKLDLVSATVSVSFDYFEHRDVNSFPVQSSTSDNYRYPHDVNLPINVINHTNYNISPSGNGHLADGLSDFYSIDEKGNKVGRELPIDIMLRRYTISGTTIPYRIGLTVFFNDEEGRLIGKKNTAILFAVSVPTCADIEIYYAWAGIYARNRLTPVYLRFCNWGAGTACYSEASTPCDGVPTVSLGSAGPALYLNQICFDHGEGLDKVWWPYSSCEIPTYQEPQSFGSFFSSVPTNGPVWMNKYLVGYDFFRDSTTSDSGYFFDCFFGTKYAIYTLDGGSVSFPGAWSGGTIVRAGDMRANTTDGVGTKSAGGWLWGTERERKVLYASIDKSMNYIDLTTGYVSNIGSDGVDGQGYLSEPAGVDLNGLTTEDFIHPFNQMRAVQIGGYPTDETLMKEFVTTVNNQPVTIPLRKCSSYWISGNIGGENWRWPLIEWWFHNDYQDGGTVTDCEGESAPSNRGEIVTGKQISWLYLDKKVKPIERGYSEISTLLSGEGNDDPLISRLNNLTLKAIILDYPEDTRSYISPPETFEGLPDEKYFIISYRPPEGSHTLRFNAPRYNSEGIVLPGAEATLQLDAGPPRKIKTDGTFIHNDPPYEENIMPVGPNINIDKFITCDATDQYERHTDTHTKRRGLIVQTPINYNALPNVIDNILISTNPSILPIRSTYQYSICPKSGLDSLPTCDEQVMPPLYECRKGGITTGSPGNYNVIMDTASFDITFNLSRPPQGADANTVWQPLIKSIEIELYQGNLSLNGNNYKAIQPSIDLSIKTYNSSFAGVGTMYDPALPGGFFKLNLDDIYLNAMVVKFSFSPPSGKNGYVVISNIKINGLVLQNSSENFTSYDRRYTPSFINKDDGVTGIGGITVTPIAGLVNSKGYGNDPVLMQDTYRGDARRFLNFGMKQVKRPILPTWPYHVVGPGTTLSLPFSSVMKGGRVVMDKPRGDMDVKGANGIGLDVASTGIQDSWPTGGSAGPGESLQEDIYTFAKNLILDDKLVYEYFMHPDEESFFTNDLGISSSNLPQNNPDLSTCTLTLSVPDNLLNFRGDSYKNYLGAPWEAPGVYVSQHRTGSCWCYVGKISKICGEPGGPEGEPSCTDRFMTMGYNGAESYISDMGHIIRRFTNVLGYAFFLTFSNGLLLDWPQLVGQPYQTPRNKSIFTSVNPQGLTRHVEITGDYIVPAGAPFYFWFNWSFAGQVG